VICDPTHSGGIGGKRVLEYRKPDHTKEAVIQAELYAACKKARLSCDLEYWIPSQEDKQSEVPDLVVIENHQIIAIVEVKIYPQYGRLITYSKDQIKRYKQFGIPVFILYSIYDIPYLVKKLVSIQKGYLRSIENTASSKCNESDKSSEKKWGDKISIALDTFNETYPDYKFTESYSLQIVATSVKALGLELVLKITSSPENKNVDDFFFELNNLLDYKVRGRLQMLNRGHPNSKIQTVSWWNYTLAEIDKKIR